MVHLNTLTTPLILIISHIYSTVTVREGGGCPDIRACKRQGVGGGLRRSRSRCVRTRGGGGVRSPWKVEACGRLSLGTLLLLTLSQPRVNLCRYRPLYARQLCKRCVNCGPASATLAHNCHSVTPRSPTAASAQTNLVPARHSIWPRSPHPAATDQYLGVCVHRVGGKGCCLGAIWITPPDPTPHTGANSITRTCPLQTALPGLTVNMRWHEQQRTPLPLQNAQSLISPCDLTVTSLWLPVSYQGVISACPQCMPLGWYRYIFSWIFSRCSIMICFILPRCPLW